MKVVKLKFIPTKFKISIPLLSDEELDAEMSQVHVRVFIPFKPNAYTFEIVRNTIRVYYPHLLEPFKAPDGQLIAKSIQLSQITDVQVG